MKSSYMLHFCSYYIKLVQYSYKMCDVTKHVGRHMQPRAYFGLYMHALCLIECTYQMVCPCLCTSTVVRKLIMLNTTIHSNVRRRRRRHSLVYTSDYYWNVHYSKFIRIYSALQHGFSTASETYICVSQQNKHFGPHVWAFARWLTRIILFRMQYM